MVENLLLAGIVIVRDNTLPLKAAYRLGTWR